MRLLVTPDYETLSGEAAAIVVKSLRLKASLTLGLPTGQTPLGMYEELIRNYRSQIADFSAVTTFNLDEYLGLLPSDHRSFHAYMRSRFFDHINVDPHNIHIPGCSSEIAIAAECERYETLIQQCGGIDLLIVGIGTNGHIAFNEPGSPLDSRTRVVTLAPETIQTTGKDMPDRAITMGVGTILEARKILLLASGAKKAEIVRRALRGRVTEAVPASALQLHSDVIVMIDENCKRGL